MQEILDCFEKIAPKVQNLILCGEVSYASSSNASGDLQLDLDVKSDLLIEQELSQLECIHSVFSEEKDEVCFVHSQGEYFVAYDPIDGSSLMDSNLSVGTIFGIYAQGFEAKHLLASGYIIYGPRLEIVIAQKGKRGSMHKRYNPYRQDWEVQEILVLNQKGKINAPGGSQQYWSKEHKAMIDGFFVQGYRLRYSGGMVPDLHQILIKKGGIFSYPATIDHQKGKLRKLFEVFPFALIFECAGGEAIDGVNRLLDLPILQTHESTPCFFGSVDEIAKVREVYAK